MLNVEEHSKSAGFQNYLVYLKTYYQKSLPKKITPEQASVLVFMSLSSRYATPAFVALRDVAAQKITMENTGIDLPAVVAREWDSVTENLNVETNHLTDKQKAQMVCDSYRDIIVSHHDFLQQHCEGLLQRWNEKAIDAATRKYQSKANAEFVKETALPAAIFASVHRHLGMDGLTNFIRAANQYYIDEHSRRDAWKVIARRMNVPEEQMIEIITDAKQNIYGSAKPSFIGSFKNDITGGSYQATLNRREFLRAAAEVAAAGSMLVGDFRDFIPPPFHEPSEKELGFYRGMALGLTAGSGILVAGAALAFDKVANDYDKEFNRAFCAICDTVRHDPKINRIDVVAARAALEHGFKR
ncbi:MAG: hypothetical protein U1E36_01435 [Rickettsiales bacterium]